MRSTMMNRVTIAALLAIVACGGGTKDELETTSSGGTTPEPRRPAVLKLSPGYRLDLRSETAISSRRQRVGTAVSATSTTDAVNGNGTVVIPAGARFTGRVTAIRPSETPNGQGQFAIEINQVEFNGHTYPVVTEVTHLGTQRVGRGITTGDAGKVGAGAVIGAVAGRVIGGNTRGAVIGGAAGAAGGAVYANRTRDIDIRLPVGGTITVALLRPFEVRANEVSSN